ncbi:hypothetical protein NL676_001732 [Syzygium grande]|nr:hypothetical protein NL676_001732 [Syzygium grande]
MVHGEASSARPVPRNLSTVALSSSAAATPGPPFAGPPPPPDPQPAGSDPLRALRLPGPARRIALVAKMLLPSTVL